MSRLNRFEEVEGRKMDAEDVDKMAGPDRLRYIEALSLQRFNPDELPNTFMYVSIAGFISSGTFKEPGFIKLDYEIVEGKDWDYVDVRLAHQGEKAGHSQGATRNYTMDEKIVWSVGFNVLYRTLEVAGWPKLVMKFESSGVGDKKLIKGYATCIFPVSPGNHRIRCHIFKPVTSQLFGLVYGDQVKEAGKTIDSRMIASGKGRDGTPA